MGTLNDRETLALILIFLSMDLAELYQTGMTNSSVSVDRDFLSSSLSVPLFLLSVIIFHASFPVPFYLISRHRFFYNLKPNLQTLDLPIVIHFYSMYPLLPIITPYHQKCFSTVAYMKNRGRK